MRADIGEGISNKALDRIEVRQDRRGEGDEAGEREREQIERKMDKETERKRNKLSEMEWQGR